jgi:hypothetical protein
MRPMAGSIALRLPRSSARRARDAAPQARAIDLHAINRNALVATIHNGDLSRNVAEDSGLLRRLSQRVAVVWVARH